MINFDLSRKLMVDNQLAARGIHDRRVMNAMSEVKREEFVADKVKKYAYADCPLSIGYGQTISQPYIVALMIQALELQDGAKVLEVGTGSGYCAAVLSRIAASVVTIEYLAPLADHAGRLVKRLGYENVTVISGDGTMGCAELGPYDGIVVTAGGPEVPESLRTQLTLGGRLVIPVGTSRTVQKLVCVTRISAEDFSVRSLCDVCFVPLYGEEGWPDEVDAIRTPMM